MAATRLTTDIEKKSLEAHVELCAERYKNGKLNSLDERMSAIDGRMDKLEGHMLDIKDKIGNVSNEGNKTLITIGTSILGILLTAVVGIIIHLATNTPS
jgi:archaellum component FlaC